MIFHFILTRFNLSLWKYDKNQHQIEQNHWLTERLKLFEMYCLPSVVAQTCKGFVWILLCDEDTPQEYRERIKAYKECCRQIELIQVEKGYACEFPHIFSEVVSSVLGEKGASDGDVCLTTYLDNDDALNKNYISIVQKCATEICNYPTFVTFDYGIQYFTELNTATRVRYPNNHFMTCVELVHNSNSIRTCYGYGSHFLLESRNSVPIRHITGNDSLMWCEVVHGDNVDNDVKMTFDTHILSNDEVEMSDYGLDIELSSAKIPFVKRGMNQILRRAVEKIRPRKWR